MSSEGDNKVVNCCGTIVSRKDDGAILPVIVVCITVDTMFTRLLILSIRISSQFMHDCCFELMGNDNLSFDKT